MQGNDTTPTVLLVDDDDNLRESIKRTLRHEPYRLIAVDSPNACLEAMVAVKPQVIISDLFMPKINGSELLVHFKENYPDVIRIMISGNFKLENVLNAVNACQVFRCLEKPCHSAALALAIRDALKQYDLIALSRNLVRMVHAQAEFINKLQNYSEEKIINTVPTDDYKRTESIKSDYDLSGLIEEALKEVGNIDTVLLKHFEK